MIAPPPRSSDARLAALDATGLLDAPPSAAFDRVTALAQRLLDVPVSLVSLVDRERQFFLSQAGLAAPWAEARETPLSHSFCQHVVAGEAPVRVEDAPGHPVFCDNLAIRDLDVVGYLGVPIRAPGGAVLGSLCAITSVPRAWSDADQATLTELAAIVEAEVALQGALAATAAEASERHEAVEELQVALDAAHLGRWQVDLATGLATQDARASVIHGGRPDGAPVPFEQAARTIHPEDREATLQAYHDVLAVGVGGRFAQEYRVADPCGAVRWVRTAGQVRDGAAGKRLVGVAWDVTDEREAAAALRHSEAALRALNDELEQRVAERTAELERSNAELDQFAYVASHDLKAPIRAIDSLAAWIVEDVGEELPATSARHLGLLRSRAARMEGLLDSLLTYSRVGRKEAAPEAVDTAALVRDAVEMVSPPEGFDVRLEGDFPVVVTPRAPLELVFRNLIGNAIKHHDQADGHVVVSAHASGGWATFAVADDGPGIAPAYQERVFGLFQTLRPRDEVEGSGMGLSIVKKAVESRGGAVSLASDGRGTTFRFRWPLRPGTHSPPPR